MTCPVCRRPVRYLRYEQVLRLRGDVLTVICPGCGSVVEVSPGKKKEATCQRD